MGPGRNRTTILQLPLTIPLSLSLPHSLSFPLSLSFPPVVPLKISADVELAPGNVAQWGAVQGRARGGFRLWS